MKNTLLSILLFLSYGQSQAAPDQTAPSQTPGSITPTTTAPPPTNSQVPQGQLPDATPTSINQLPSAVPTPPIIDCDYKIAASTKNIDSTLITTWAGKATVQAFDFDPMTVDNQLQKLQACFTDQGWTSFNTAFQKSGNLEAIKSQKLNVSSQLSGQVQITDAKENQWKVTVPLQVVYQNDKEKLTQLLTVNLTIGRKITGDLGITQIIAAPQSPQLPANTANPTVTTPPTTETAPPK